ncbi:dihydroxyacetone kinase phosphoryl donor subunit DhaM [Halobacillus litoralis]|uniref:dihydroxyacetone kinase phosphoryl donor subunit DhaM n=1 Tax=Halobacillus litoralis TaxID=45668 RepID=UPI001CFDFF07|nr:dihydroxyacetone kinase phosphoryl donor subunit DhaM [Halobacillus litoralis]
MSSTAIVVVSHSEKVAEGIKELLQQVVGDVPVEAAGGSEIGGIGTSFERIQNALEKVRGTCDGTLVFYDLGSARMNAEMAIEMLDSESIQLVTYPILEGAYLAAVESSIDKPMDEIINSLKKEFDS